jgi:ArsR family transcriptional regulator
MEHLCGVNGVEACVIKERRSALPEENKLVMLYELFKLFGDGTRLKILFSLDGGPLCVCEIAEVLNMSKSRVSHQLKLLRQSDLIRCERQGKNVYYCLADSHVKDIIEKALEHIEEDKNEV